MSEVPALVLNLSDYLSIPRDIETISRSIRRNIQRAYQEVPHDYISGDSFKSRCSLQLDHENWRSAFETANINSEKPFRFFVPGIPQSDVFFQIIDYIKSNPNLHFSNVSLVLHNGEHWPDAASISSIATRFDKIFAVNWLGNARNVYPIPIGLENQGLLINGVVKDFLSLQSNLIEWERRPIKLLVCFSVNTNRSERQLALQIAKQTDGAFIVEKPITPKKYRKLLCQAKYTLSPPGNGVDCHRTWEAIFLGSTPVVKRAYWPFQSIETGAIVVEDWGDIRNLPLQRIEPSQISTQELLKVDQWLEK